MAGTGQILGKCLLMRRRLKAEEGDQEENSCLKIRHSRAITLRYPSPVPAKQVMPGGVTGKHASIKSPFCLQSALLATQRHLAGIISSDLLEPRLPSAHFQAVKLSEAECGQGHTAGKLPQPRAPETQVVAAFKLELRSLLM